MLARKISRSKWARKEYLKDTEIRADAITGCLRTKDDRLSWWRCTDDTDDVEEVALALTAGPQIERFDKIDVVVLPESEFYDVGLASESSEGSTAVRDLRSRHVDLVCLDLVRLSAVANILDPVIREYRNNVFQFTRAELIKLVRTAIRDTRLDLKDLNPKLQQKLCNHA